MARMVQDNVSTKISSAYPISGGRSSKSPSSSINGWSQSKKYSQKFSNSSKFLPITIRTPLQSCQGILCLRCNSLLNCRSAALSSDSRILSLFASHSLSPFSTTLSERGSIPSFLPRRSSWPTMSSLGFSFCHASHCSLAWIFLSCSDKPSILFFSSRIASYWAISQ